MRNGKREQKKQKKILFIRVGACHHFFVESVGDTGSGFKVQRVTGLVLELGMRIQGLRAQG
jgi:hypothetical protein